MLIVILTVNGLGRLGWVQLEGTFAVTAGPSGACTNRPAVWGQGYCTLPVAHPGSLPGGLRFQEGMRRSHSAPQGISPGPPTCCLGINRHTHTYISFTLSMDVIDIGGEAGHSGLIRGLGAGEGKIQVGCVNLGIGNSAFHGKLQG